MLPLTHLTFFLVGQQLQNTPMAPQNAIVQRATAGIEELKAQLERGELISPVDNITADGSKLCGGEPLYHDLRCMPYTKYDVQEWIGKLRKFKAETVRYASQSRRLECGVKKLQQELAQSTEAFSVIESRIELVDGNTAHLSAGLQEGTVFEFCCLGLKCGSAVVFDGCFTQKP